MDKRLEDVRTTDLTESNINEDFVDWLKRWGMPSLVVVMAVFAGFAAKYSWSKNKAAGEAVAWSDFHNAQLPGAFEKVAEDYGDIGHLQMHSLLSSAQVKLLAVQRNVQVSALGTLETDLTPDMRLDATTRATLLDEAAALFENVINLAADDAGLALPAGTALAGRAAVAEARGKAEDAVDWYERAADRFEAMYPALAEEARRYAETAGQYTSALELPSSEVAVENGVGRSSRPTEAPIEPVLESLLPAMPEDDAGS